TYEFLFIKYKLYITYFNFSYTIYPAFLMATWQATGFMFKRIIVKKRIASIECLYDISKTCCIVNLLALQAETSTFLNKGIF
ncbi:hypothetical protein ACJX0J_005968, partial [Zea mays]